MARTPKEIRVASISDIHVPYTDYDRLDWAVSVAAREKPTHFVLNGDLLDCTGISTHGSEHKHSLEDEIHEGADVLKTIRLAMPRTCKLILRLGNHEQRINREAGEVSPYLRSMISNWATINDEYRRWSVGEYEKTRKGVTLIGPFAFTHGHRVGGNSDDVEAIEIADILQRRGIVVVRGHTHRVVQVDRVKRTSTVMEDRLWRANTGTLAAIGRMRYAKQIGSVGWGAGVFLGFVRNNKWSARVEQPPLPVRVA